MTDEQLSAAIVSYIWGARLPYPTQRPEALSAAQRPYLPQIKAIITTAFESDPGVGTLAEQTRRIEALLSAEYPELSPQALRALGDDWSFNFR